jgi:hypothetical protein
VAVDALAGEGDIELLTAALEPGSATKQLIAMQAACRLAPDRTRRALQSLVSARDDRVRLAAARALANLGERKPVLDTLVSLLHSPSVAIRNRSHQSLQALTGEHLPFAVEGSPADREAAVEAWQKWVQSHGSTAMLLLPLGERLPTRGRVLVVSPSTMVELDAGHKESWRLKLPGAAWGCQGLPNGHRLVAIHSHSMVIEYDDGGREVWRKDRLPGPPTTVERLASGATLVACSSANEVVEVAPDGSTSPIPAPGNPVCAQRLESGNTLVALSDSRRVVEIDRGGTVRWEADIAGQIPAFATRLISGNTLIAIPQARQVIEVDPTGKKIVWSTQSPLINPSAAQRLATGNTLVADYNGLYEFDTSGRPLPWRHLQQHVTGLSSF